MYGNEELIESLNYKKSLLLEEKRELKENYDEKQEFLTETTNEINLICNDKEAYKTSKKNININSIINILQIIGTFSLLFIPLNFLPFFEIGVNTINNINKFCLFLTLFGSSIILGLNISDKIDLKKRFNRSTFSNRLNNLEENKEYLEENIKDLQKRINKINRKINKLNDSINMRQTNKKYNHYIENVEINKIKRKQLKKNKNMI